MADREEPAGSGWDEAARSREKTTFPRPMTVYQRPHSIQVSAVTIQNWEKRLPLTPSQEKSDYDQWDGGNSTLGEKEPEISSTKGATAPTSFFGIYDKVTDIENTMRNEEDQVITYPTGWKWFLILLSGVLPYIVVVLDDTIIATIIPVLVSEFRQSADIGWYATAYFLPMTVLMPVFGKCYALWKIKWLFVLSLVILLVGSITCATTLSSLMFIVGRAIAGAGAAGIINGAMRIIGVSSPRKERTFLEAAGAIVMGGCTVAGPILGGVIADSVGWRWAFWLNVPIALGALIVILVVFPDQAPTTSLFRLSLVEKVKRLDPIGSLTLIGALCSLVTLLESQATRLGPLGTEDWHLSIATGVLFTTFFIHEFFVRADLALIPSSVLRHRSVWSCSIVLFFLFAGFINFVFFLSIFFQSIRGETPLQSAVSLIPYVVAASVGATLVGIGISFVHYYNPFFILGGISFAIGSAFIYTFDDKTKFLKMSIFEAVLGIGAGFLTLANIAPCHIQLEEKDHSVANGFLFLSSLLGATLSLPISSMIFNQNLFRDTLALDIPVQVKLEFLSDPTKLHSVVPAESLSAALGVLVDAIRKTFLLGLVCACVCALATGLVPFRRLIVDNKPEPRDVKIAKNMNRLSAGYIVGSLPPPRGTSKGPYGSVEDNDRERLFRAVSGD
ncbi:major facilitator superfamily domain-containing protein [Leptodontidium sp. MPI-SDFR-AT-0119]|nr:major facilitator superfamily domain-containing protein [Leptodontidium sp. MPI-SDFR-AT-0119]